MIITDREGSGIRKTSIRRARTWNSGGLTLLMPTGEIVQDLLSPTPGVWGIYMVKNNRIERFRHPQNAFLVGMDESEFVFVSKTNEIGDSLVTRVKSLAGLQDMAAPIPRPQGSVAR